MNISFNPTTLSAGSRAAQYGDGCFTTLLLDHGNMALWPLHLARLKSACQRLRLYGFNGQQLQQETHTWLAKQKAQGSVVAANKGVMKIVVAAPPGGRGYRRNDDNELDVVITTHPYPEHYQIWQQSGITLGVSAQMLGHNASLAGLKHLNRLEQVLMKSTANSNLDDELICDAQGMVVEASAANVFWRVSKQWYTPDLSECGVAGVQRQSILMSMSERGMGVQEVRSHISQLVQADEMFVCNSVMEWAPVKQLHIVNPHTPTSQKIIKDFEICSAYLQRALGCLERAK